MINNRITYKKAVGSLPIDRGKKDVKLFLENFYSNYLKNFEGDFKKVLDKRKELIEEIIFSITSSLELYLNGLPNKSFQSISVILDKLKKENILPVQQYSTIEGQDEYFRIRVGTRSHKKTGLFHIPFNLREKVSTQRYSIPGFPCIYMGDSIYVCWEEMGRPSIHEISVSRFDLNGSNFKLLYLNDSPIEYLNKCFDQDGNVNPSLHSHLSNFLTLYPLLVACSITVTNKQEVFKKGPYKGGTNNIGEFLALVHGIALLKKKGLHKMPIYSDSKIAMSWVKKKECRTNIVFDSSNKDLLDLITRAEKWLKENSYRNPILKWETKAWGEIPADFGRK